MRREGKLKYRHENDNVKLQEFVKIYGKRYSEQLAIDLRKEPFKWLLASVLFAAPIRESTAMKTYKIFDKYGYTTPRKILEAGWDEIVRCLDEGGYTRYDFKTADKILEVCRNLVKEDLHEIYKKAKDGKDLEKRLKNLSKGIGDATISIFLREMDIWEKATHPISKYAEMSAKNVGLWEDGLKEVEGIDKVELEIALMKVGRDYCRKNKCNACPIKSMCIKRQKG